MRSYGYPDELMSRNFLLERMRVHAHFYLSNSPMLRDTCSLNERFDMLDRDFQQCFLLLADMAKGETTTEDREVKREVTFDVFASWWDHFKFRLKVGRLAWLPEEIKRRIKIRYQTIAKEVNVKVPVTVTRACPHVTQDWKDRPDLHVSFLKPMEWSRQRE